MGRLKLTSPGILLILSVIAAGSILVLDAFYLRPHVRNQEQEALRNEAVRVEHEARLVLLAEQNTLQRLCVTVVNTQEMRRFPARGASREQFDTFAEGLVGYAGVEMAWVTDADGDVLQVWSGDQEDSPSSPVHLREAVAASVRCITDSGNAVRTGLMRLFGRTAIFARQDITDPRRTSVVKGALWLGRYLDGAVMTEIRSAVRGDVTFVTADSLPPGALDTTAKSQVIAPAGEGTLGVSWLAQDAAGAPLGYFHVKLPVHHIRLQAAGARRVILITLFLSVGLVVLIILGTHVLIAGPIIRLLRRLQQLESGKGSDKKLTRDLHGEPLVLARRLESAFDRLAYISKTDLLTGLANRRHFEEVLRSSYHQARRYHRPLSLMMMDIDFFKAVNDTGGHQVGDELLKVLATAIRNASRKPDLPARLGGDEFAVLLPETAAAEAHSVAERIRQTVSGEPVAVRSMELNVTLSVGVVDLDAGEIDSPQTMLVLADRALYAAKELGRNRVVQGHDLTGLSLSQRTKESDDVNLLCKKLAGLDMQFKGLFLRAVEEIVELLAERNPNMAGHARRVERYSVLIAQEMGLPERVIKRIQIAATLHDIGMIAMPDSILLSQGKLNKEQFQIMRKHPLLSVKIMEGMEFLEQEIPTVRYHHERYDGGGYPEGISGAAIPLTARILTVGDAFDAMTSRRTFRPAKTVSEGLDELKRGAGTQFDPAVVDTFISLATRLGNQLIEEPTEETAQDVRERVPEKVAPG